MLTRRAARHTLATMKSLRSPRIRAVGPATEIAAAGRGPSGPGTSTGAATEEKPRVNSSLVLTQPAARAARSTRCSRPGSVIVNGVCLRRGTARVSAMTLSSNAASARPELDE